MPDWEVTATTIYCESIDDEVTLIVTGDGVVSCTGLRRYEKPDKNTTKLLNSKSRSRNRHLVCAGSGCTMISQYREKMLSGK